MPNGLSADQDDMVDADIRRFVDAIGAAYAAHGAPADAGLAERRLVAERVRQPWREGGPIMAESVDLDMAGIRLRLHRPTAPMKNPWHDPLAVASPSVSKARPADPHIPSSAHAA